MDPSPAITAWCAGAIEPALGTDPARAPRATRPPQQGVRARIRD